MSKRYYMNSIIYICIITLFLISPITAYNDDEDVISPEEIAKEVESKSIYYVSTVRIQHTRSKYHLHSHEIRYGTGSGQQSVTGMKIDNDYNSLWTIREAFGQPIRLYSELLACDDIIRLEHALSHKYLHSHDFRAQISGRYEVSCFGDNGSSDQGDNWRVVCENQAKSSIVTGKTTFALQHILTKRYLTADSGISYDQRNCGMNCPIMGQLEISCDDRNGANAKWKIVSV